MKLIEQYEQIVNYLKKKPFPDSAWDGQELGVTRLEAEEAISITELLHQAYPVTLEELAIVLHCTYRNVKLILKRMQDKQWIQWQPGRGRGNHSKLTLRKDSEELWLDQVRIYLDRDQWERAAQILSRLREAPRHRADLFQKIESSFSAVKKVTKGNRVQDTLRFISYRPMAPLDPALVTRRTELHMVQQIFEGLVSYDRETKQLKPHLAIDLECGSDYRTWAFQLRKGVYFHQEEELQAQDVVRSFERLKQLSSPYRWMHQLIQRIEAASLYTVRFTLADSLPVFPHFLAAAPFYIVKEESQRLWGTGPFKVTILDQERLVLEGFSQYFQERPQLDRIEIYYLSQVYQIQNGEASQEVFLPHEVNFQHFRYPSVSKEGWQTVTSLDRGCKYVMINGHKKGALHRREARKAFLGLLDRCKMIQELGENRYSPAPYFLPRQEKDEFQSQISGQTAGVDQLLKEPIHLLTYHGAGNEGDVYWIQQQAERFGVTLQVTIRPYEKMWEKDLWQEVDLILAEQWMNHDPVWTFTALLTQEHSLLYRCLAGSPLYQEILKEIGSLLTLPKEQERWETCLRLEQQLLQDHLFYPLYHWQQSAQFPEHVQGVQLNELGWVDYHRIWFKG